MNKRTKLLLHLVLIMSIAIVGIFSYTQTASAYSYDTNLLTTTSKNNHSSGDRKMLSYTQTIELSQADMTRANKGDLYYNAYVYLGANGSRTVSRALLVMCQDSEGNFLSDGRYEKSGKTYWVAHAHYKYNSGDITIPEGTAKIIYTTGVGIGSRGDLELYEMYLKLYDNVKPVYSVSAPATVAGTYPAQTTIRYSVNFNEAIGTVTNSGTFKTNLGTATYVGLSSDRMKLYYDFTIPVLGMVSNYQAVKMDSLSGVVVKDDAGNVSKEAIVNSFTDNYGIYTDNKFPSVSLFTTEASANADYKVGEKITFNVTFDENIKVSGSPYILLSNGKKAIYTKKTESDTNMASFVYTVSSSDTNTAALNITGINFTGIVDKVNQSATSSSNYDVNMYNDFLNSYNLGIDTDAPNVSFADPTTVWHKNDYVVKISPTDDISGIDELYSVWTTSAGSTAPTFPTAANVSSSYEVTNPTSSGTYYLWIKAVDKAGNLENIKSSYAYKFDFTPPNITIAPSYISGYTAIKSVNVNVSDNVDVATKVYEWRDSNNLKVAEGDLNDEMIYPSGDGLYSLIVTATDDVGNISTKTASDLFIDKTGPTAIFTPNSNSIWSKSSDVSVEVSDEKTGVKSYEYKWSDSELTPTSGWEATTNTLFTSPNGETGTYYLHIKAIDNAGNVGYLVSKGFNIDNTKPAVIITPNGNSEEVLKTKYEIGVIAQDAITATADLDKSYVFSTAESSYGLEFLPFTYETVILENFSEDTYLYIKVSDEAGNITVFKSNAFIADTTPPTGSITNTSGEYINQSAVNLSFVANDNCAANSDIKMKLIIDDIDDEWESFLSSKTIGFNKAEGNHTISVKFKDKNDNESSLYSTSFVYDITPPEIYIDYEPGTTTGGSVKATVTTTTSSSIVGETSHVFIENGSYTFEALDEAGNTSKKDAVVNWIDKAVPTIRFSSDEFDNKKHRSATVEINCEDDKSGITSVKYRIVKEGSLAGEWFNCSNGETIDISGVLDGQYYIEATAKDGVGNEFTKSSGYVYIDVTKPTGTVEYSISTRTAQNVEAHIKFDEVAFITNNDKSNIYLFKDNGEFTFEFEDEAGNNSVAVAKVDWIDRDKPEARISITDESFNKVSQDKWVNYDLFVTIIPPAESIINDLTFNGDLVSEITTGTSISSDIKDCGNNTYLVKKYGVFNFVVHDTDTLLESEGEITLRIDKNDPEFVNEVRTTNSWTKENVVVTITASDDLSSVTYVDGNSYKFTKNGSHAFVFTDEAGNEGSYTAKVENIDKDVPTANISYTVDGVSYNDEYTNKDIRVKVDFDDLSPVIIINNGGKDEYTFTSNGEFTFEYTDEAGNSGDKKVVIDKIDKTAPTAYVSYSSTTWTNNDVVATLKVSDELGGSGEANDGETYTFVENGDYGFIAKDNAGNESNITASAIRIDKTSPILSYSLSPSGNTPFSVFATVTANESVTWLNNGGSPSKQFKSNGGFTFKAKDYAGNESEITVNITNITRESTPVVLNYSTIEPTSGDVYVTISPENEANDVIFVINNEGSKTYKFEENGEFTFRYRNPAGIMGEVTASVTNINKTPPVVTAEYSTTNLTTDNVIVTLSADKDVIYPFAAIDGTYTFYKNDKVQIPVTDTVGNVTYVLLEVDWIDKDAPKIVLEKQYETFSVGDVFDANDGVSVLDANEIPNGIEINGEVSTSTIGDYEITYKATDSAGNTAEMKKYVTVYDPNEFNVIINDKMPVNSEVEILENNMTLKTINQTGNLKLLLASGKEDFGYFKKHGKEINNQYTLESKGYYTLYMQDDNRHTKLVYVFVK